MEAFTHIVTEGYHDACINAGKPDQSIMIGDDIEITVLEVRGEQVRLGIMRRAPSPYIAKRCSIRFSRATGFPSFTARWRGDHDIKRLRKLRKAGLAKIADRGAIEEEGHVRAPRLTLLALSECKSVRQSLVQDFDAVDECRTVGLRRR